MIDFHSHILPGLDDGSASLDESLEMGRQLVGAGFSEVCCTPHCMKGVYENTTARVKAMTAELQSEFDRAGITLKLHAGMEYYLDEFFPEQLDRLLPLGETGMVLIEAPTGGYHDMIRDFIFQIRRRRFTPLFAHPERYDFFASEREDRVAGFFRKAKKVFSMSEPEKTGEKRIQNTRLTELKDMGCLYQGNLGSFAGLYGAGVREQARSLRAAGLYHCYGSDAHSARQIRMLARESNSTKVMNG